MLITTHTNTVLLYCDSTLKWAAQVPQLPVDIKIAKIG